MTDGAHSDGALGPAALDALRTQQFLPFETDNATDTTSGLSVDEQLAIAQVGYEAQDIVTGAAVATLGNYGKNTLHPFRSYEIARLSGLLGSARQRAVQEMERQCADIGAAGVIGVHLDLRGTEEEGLATFVATGTAIRTIGAPTDADARGRALFTSSLSGHDFHLLLRSGCAPVGFVVGTSSFHFGWRSFGAWAASQGRCTEMTSLTSSLYAAREAAVQRLSRQASDVGADGVIDVKVLERSNVWGSHVIEFVAYGTAITVGNGAIPSVDPDVLVMLNDIEGRGGGPQSHTFERAESHSE